MKEHVKAELDRIILDIQQAQEQIRQHEMQIRYVRAFLEEKIKQREAIMASNVGKEINIGET